MITYRLRYSDGTTKVKSFNDKWEFYLFVKNEGDHLIGFERI